MVYLTPRFLFLAALVATAAMPTFVLQSNARAVDLVERHHDKSSHGKQSASLASKGHNKVQSKPTIPLPPSAKTVKGQGKKSKKHRKAGKKHERDILASKNDTWDPLDPVVQVAGISVGDGRGGSYSDTHDLMPGLEDILRRDPESEHHHHHHHHHHHGRQEQESQTTFSLHRRRRSRIYGKRERKIEEIEKQEMLEEAEAKTATAEGRGWDKFDPLLKVGNFEIGDRHHGLISETHSLLPRSPGPHHHHHHDHHEYHDKVVVNGDDDEVHVHERRDPRHHHHHHHHGDHDKVIVNGNNDKVHVHERREPHHHHHHHGHHAHDKTVINGDNDDVHIHERRDPRHHHHHHGEHKTVINGDNDNVHIHNRGVDSYDDILDVYLGLDMCGSSINGHEFKCNVQRGHQKRSAALENMPGVPGTVDIMAVGGNTMEKLASLILSSAPDNSSTTDISGSLNDSSKAADDANLSPFVLDASNSTQTQFFLVAAETAPSVPSAPSTSFANTLSVLKSAASSKDDELDSQDIKVTLQVLVFEPSEAAMRPYCATFDPNPPAPAALTMDKCFSDSISQNTGKMTETSLHKSQTFLYNPTSGVLRPKWFGVTGGVPLNATEPTASVPIPSNGTSTSSSSGSSPSATSGATMDAKQMNFKIPTSNKNAPAHLPGPVSGIVGNVTQTVNGTLPAPLPSPPSPPIPNPQNVTLVFTPVGMAIHSVNGASGVASFEPVNGNGNDASDSESNEGDDADEDDFTDASLSSSTSTSTGTDSATATTTDGASISESSGYEYGYGYSGMPAGKADATSDATSVSASATVSASGTMTESMPTSTGTVTVDEAAMEKMYQNPRDF